MVNATEISSESIDAEGIGSSDFKPHLPLPYATKMLRVVKETQTASYATASLTLQAGDSNWIANHDVFPYWIMFEIEKLNYATFMSKHYEGFEISVYRDTDDFLLTKTLTALEKPPLLYSTLTAGDWLWRQRFNILGTHVLAAQTLTIDIKNCTEVSIDDIEVIIHAILAKGA